MQQYDDHNLVAIMASVPHLMPVTISDIFRFQGEKIETDLPITECFSPSNSVF